MSYYLTVPEYTGGYNNNEYTLFAMVDPYDDVIEPFRKMADTLNNLARTK